MSKRPKITTTTATRKGEKPPSSLYHIYGYHIVNVKSKRYPHNVQQQRRPSSLLLFFSGEKLENKFTQFNYLEIFISMSV
ncbi:hypothetical protein DERP_010471 [Dermatophagoides pteronyssinus]|uniref:Uncharacterized protein n=1 Tax=Dermatophagoides pteronyssinus TaxID=6956 RepID=A0ABQ8J598_DERPT|nr:hypothetical protein DERP_010471 [Dermatophagoides pteronyssinus]